MDKMKKMTVDTQKDKKERHTAQLKCNHLQKAHNKINLPCRICRQVQPVRLKRISSRQKIRTYAKRKDEIIDFRINVRVMMLTDFIMKY